MPFNHSAGRVALCAVFALAASIRAHAQSPFPDHRPIAIVVPSVAGGATDIVARFISKSLGAALDTTVIVDNKGGANGNLGGAYVARAKPDGHTLLLAPTNNIVTNQFTTLNMGYDPIADLAPVALVAEAPEMIAVPSGLPARDLKEFIGLARAKPGSFSYGSPGVGTVPHLSVERLKRVMDLQMTHVPYRGAAAAMTDIAAGSIQMTMAALASVEPFSQSGAARVLAVAASKRLKPLPDVPTLGEAGWKNQEMSNWWGIMAPTGLPPEIARRLNVELRRTFEDPETVATLEKIGVVARSESIEDFQAFIQRDLKAWEAVIKDIGLTPQ